MRSYFLRISVVSSSVMVAVTGSRSCIGLGSGSNVGSKGGSGSAASHAPGEEEHLGQERLLQQQPRGHSEARPGGGR